MKTRLVALSCASLLAACAGKPAAETPAAPGAAAPAALHRVDELVIVPEKAAPEGLSAAEKGELSGPCMPLFTAMIEGEALGMRALDDAMRDGVADADGAGVVAASARVKKTTEGLAPADHQRCVGLFERQQLRKQFDHDPAEAEARAVVDTCVKRVEAVYGKQSMAFGDSAKSIQGPFCPDDFPVPVTLAELPYQSTKTDWDTPAWRCLQFGLRSKQRVQVEFSAPIGSGEFTCTGRYRPRQGGAPIEFVRGGKQGPEGQLLLSPKMSKRRMSAK